MNKLSTIKMYTTHPHPCSYLEGKEATTLFIDPDTDLDAIMYSELAYNGFRRSGNHVYRPQCQHCSACMPARIPVTDFKQKRSQRRVWQKNQDLLVTSVSDIHSDEHYELYSRYISQRHQDGDMFPPSLEQYLTFLNDKMDVTQFYCFHHQSKLVAVAVTDQLSCGLSAIYTFFDPDYPQRSLGQFAILWQIEQAKKMRLPYLYLGYWIKNCRKMDYKFAYRPLELLIKGNWIAQQ